MYQAAMKCRRKSFFCNMLFVWAKILVLDGQLGAVFFLAPIFESRAVPF